MNLSLESFELRVQRQTSGKEKNYANKKLMGLLLYN
jgi:hypothetical protein